MITKEQLDLILFILIGWTAVWMYYNKYIRPKYKPNPLLNDPLTQFKIELPSQFKCYIKNVSSRKENNDCRNEDIDGWTLGHIAIYFTIGLFVHDVEWAVLFISFGCEIWEYFAGWRARWVLDPLTNFAGYMLGVMTAKQLGLKAAMASSTSLSVNDIGVDVHSVLKTCILLLLLAIQLHYCHPSKMNYT